MTLSFFKEPVCPRCVEPLRNPKTWKEAPQSTSCPNCHFPIPSAYLRDAKKTPPVFVQLMGLTRVGKTTFLDMLRIQLYDMSKMWPGSFALPITQPDAYHRQTLRTERMSGTLASSTVPRGRDQNVVYIMQLMNMERWNSHFLALMDFSGEQFNTLHIAIEDVPFLRWTPTTIMLLSLTDMEREGKTVDELLITYVTTLELHGVNFAKMPRQLIIVFNKADIIRNLPPEVDHYVKNDQSYLLTSNNQPVPNMRGEQLRQYLAYMAHISDVLRHWTEHSVPGGSSMLALLQHRNIHARFTAMSATGHEISNNVPGLKPVPRRVLDPFFWVMETYAGRP